jgi:hypothetical protein
MTRQYRKPSNNGCMTASSRSAVDLGRTTAALTDCARPGASPIAGGEAWTVDRAGRPSLLWLNLLGGIVLETDRVNEVQLCLQPLDMFLALDDQVLEELSRAGIALL